MGCPGFIHCSFKEVFIFTFLRNCTIMKAKRSDIVTLLLDQVGDITTLLVRCSILIRHRRELHK